MTAMCPGCDNPACRTSGCMGRRTSPKIMKVYLCGPILGRNDEECIAWRERATELLKPHEALNPVIARDARGRELEPGMAKAVVEGDIADISNSDALLVMFDQPSVGTSMEIRAAYSQFMLPIFCVYKSDMPMSPWLMYHVTEFAEDLESACWSIKQYLSANKRPCGECHLAPGETCDICGATAVTNEGMK